MFQPFLFTKTVSHALRGAQPLSHALFGVKILFGTLFGIRYLLGFNEPDLASQGNLTVDEVLDLWPQLEAIGVPPTSASHCEEGDGRHERECERQHLGIAIAECWHWDCGRCEQQSR